MRLFVALWTPSEILETLPLSLLQEHLTRQGVRFTRPEKIHLTLRYLGNVLEDQVEPLTASLAEALAGISEVELTASGLGAFPNIDRPKVVWAGVHGDLTALHQRVIEATDDVAEQPADAWEPHLTLARVSPPSQKVGRALEPLVRQTAGELFGSWIAREVLLVQTQADGSYHIMAEFPLVPSTTP